MVVSGQSLCWRKRVIARSGVSVGAGRSRWSSFMTETSSYATFTSDVAVDGLLDAPSLDMRASRARL